MFRPEVGLEADCLISDENCCVRLSTAFPHKIACDRHAGPTVCRFSFAIHHAPPPAPAPSHRTLLSPPQPYSALQLMLEIIAVRLWQPAPMPRHLLQTLSRLGHSDRRCMWYYANYGRSGTPYEGSPSSSSATGTGGGNGGGGGNGEEEFAVAERKPEWDKVYVLQSRGGIRVGFQPVSTTVLLCSRCRCCHCCNHEASRRPAHAMIHTQCGVLALVCVLTGID